MMARVHSLPKSIELSPLRPTRTRPISCTLDSDALSRMMRNAQTCPDSSMMDEIGGPPKDGQLPPLKEEVEGRTMTCRRRRALDGSSPSISAKREREGRCLSGH